MDKFRATVRFWFGLTVLLIMLAGCSSSTPVPTALPPTAEPPPTAKPSSTAKPSPTAKLTPVIFNKNFTSKRHGYSIEYPDGWLATEQAGEWESGDILYKGAGGVDMFSAPGGSTWIVIGAQPVPKETTLEQWINTNTEVFLKVFGGTCGEPVTREPTTIGDEATISTTYHCSDGYFGIFLYALHEGRGYVAFWRSARGNEAADQETFNQFVTSFAFAP